MKNIFKSGVLVALVTLCCSMYAFADNNGLTVYDAHSLLVSMVERRMLGSLTIGYWGQECKSRFSDTRPKERNLQDYTTEIDWSEISSKEVLNSSDGIGVRIHGNIIVHYSDGDVRQMSDDYFGVPDAVQLKRLGNAVQLLIDSCAKKSKFD